MVIEQRKLRLRELDTVLAALRFWQNNTDAEYRRYNPISGARGKPLDDDEINELCEEFNCGDTWLKR